MNTKIRDTLSRKPECELVDHDVFRISKRIKDIDSGYFILLNRITGKYEVHNSTNIGGTYCFKVPYGELDVRTLDYCAETLVENNISESIERYNERLKRAKKRESDNRVSDASMLTADKVSHAVDEDMLHEGYSKSHIMGGAYNGDN